MLYSEHSIAETEVESPLHVEVIVTRGTLAHNFSNDCIILLLIITTVLKAENKVKRTLIVIA